MKLFGQFCAVLVMTFFSIFMSGVVLSYLWNWFIVPLGFPSIGFWLAIGVSMVVCLLVASPSDRTGDLSADFAKFFTSCGVKIASKLILWGLGAIVKGFI